MKQPPVPIFRLIEKTSQRAAIIRIALLLCCLVAWPTVPSQAQEGESIRFAVIGDYGDSGSPFIGEIARMIETWQVDFIVAVGDNNYPDGEYQFDIRYNMGQVSKRWRHRPIGERLERYT